MREIEIEIDAGRVVSDREIEAAAKELSLVATLKGTLAKYPGSIHWHFKNGRERGALEVTLQPAERRVWVSIQDGRRGEWVERAAREMVELLRG
jgi:hypothetical protein